jgi:hypothetical protein
MEEASCSATYARGGHLLLGLETARVDRVAFIQGIQCLSRVYERGGHGGQRQRCPPEDPGPWGDRVEVSRGPEAKHTKATGGLLSHLSHPSRRGMTQRPLRRIARESVRVREIRLPLRRPLLPSPGTPRCGTP